ncbi:hypothetical protein ACFL1B_01215 [Nanoarchaeota archaeon]
MRRFIQEWGPGILILLAICLALFPLMVRTMNGDPLVPGSESYYNLRIAHQIKEDFTMDYDQLQQRPYNMNLYHYILAVLLFISPSDSLLLILSVMLSFSTAFLLFGSLARLKTDRVLSFIITAVYLLSPLYIYVTTTITAYSVIIFLLVLSFYLFAKKLSVWSIMPAALTILIEPSAFLVFLAVLLTYCYYTQKGYREVGLGFLAGIVIGLIGMTFNYQAVFSLTGGLNPSYYTTDFGATIGYSFFTLLLAATAIIIHWKTGMKAKMVHIFMVMLVIFSTLSQNSRLVMNCVLCVYSGMAIYFFMKRAWVVPVLRDLTLLVIMSSLLFSSISFTSRTSDMEPIADTLKALYEISLIDSEGAVLSTPENGYIIEYFAGKPAYLDELSQIYSDYTRKRTEYQEIISSRSPELTKKLLKGEEIDFIYFDPKTITVFEQQNSGLLLVLEHSENFINLASFRGRQSWLYISI